MDTMALNAICTRGGLTDGSGACNGSSKEVFAENINRRYLVVQNISDEDIYLNVGAAATTDNNSIKLAAGAGYVFEAGFVPTGAVNVIGTNGKKYVAKEG